MLPQLILIPGLLNDAELFRDQVADLADVARPVVADITQGTTLDALAEAVLETAEDRFALVGFSLGGIIAQHVMRVAPHRVTHLILMSTTMLPDNPDRAAERQRLIAAVRSPGRFHGFGEKLLETYLAPQNLSDQVMAARVRLMTERLGPEVFVRQSLIERPDNRDVLRGLSCPVLVICGEHDRLTTPKLHQEMASEIPGAQLAIVKDSGHLVPLERPAAVSTAVRRLLLE